MRRSIRSDANPSELYDLAQVTIPTDNVDPALIRRPQRWDIRLIRNFMIVIGPVSSLYDFLTFFVLLRVFQFDEARFQSGWFLESLATQALVLFVIRTVGSPWTDRPSSPLTVTTLLVVLVGALLPYTPVGPALGLYPLPAAYFMFLAVVVGTYLVLVEIVKELVMRPLFGKTQWQGLPVATRDSRGEPAAST
jgi:P-type Mg2+ transporter